MDNLKLANRLIDAMSDYDRELIYENRDDLLTYTLAELEALEGAKRLIEGLLGVIEELQS